MDPDVILWVWVLGGGLASYAVSALLWDHERLRWLRLLPIAYFLVVGFGVGVFLWEERGITGVLEAVIIHGLIGTVFFLVLWLYGRQR